MLLPLSPADFESYLAALRWLVNVPSPFTEPAAVSALMAAVRARMQRFLPAYTCALDEAGNLTCVPASIEAARPLLYLSAHLDTVPSEPALWSAPFTPHPAYEDAEQLVAQGVNDCKAGVATQLWLAHLVSTGAITLSNVIFTFTFKEEGAGPKTGVTLGHAFGHALPAPTAGSTLLVLENTVRSDAPYLPLCYTAESSSYTIRLTGSLTQLRSVQLKLADWRPVSITPTAPTGANYTWTHHAPLGHVCTAPAEKNPLVAALMAIEPHALLRAGDERSHGTVPAAIGLAKSPKAEVPHRLTLTKRGNFPLPGVLAELAAFDYTAVKPLTLSSGFDVAERCAAARVGAAFITAVESGHAGFERNPGSSDATIITSSLPPAYQALILPLVYGPGTRSQRQASPQRLTHGPNETFMKVAGRQSLEVLFAALHRAGHVT
ncbi:MAG: M20/M25/M40 family metallo-hydrolase [Opitutaceae bacterium]